MVLIASPMQSSSGATHATMLTANVAVTRVAVGMPAGGAVLNVAPSIFGSRTDPIGQYSGEDDHQALTNEWQQWVVSGHPGVARKSRTSHRGEKRGTGFM